MSPNPVSPDPVRTDGSTWWGRRSHAEKFDLYTRWSLYPLSAVVPLVTAALLIGSGSGGPSVAIVGLGVMVLGHAVLALLVLRNGLARLQQVEPTDRGVVLALVLVTLVVAATAPMLAGDTVDFGRAPGVLTTAVVVGGAGAALTPRMNRPQLGIAMLATAGLVVGLRQLTVPGADLATSLRIGWTSAAVLILYWLSVWMLQIVWELHRSREVHARLAVAEERLRFSRDLHDVFGRTLSIVALKSELAAELGRRGRAEAVDTMLEVRQIAQDALTEVREVAGGYRAADLAAELRGARSVLESAGIRCTSVGADGELDPAVATALAWVVREAVTNVVRHSQATSCSIAVSRTDFAVALEIVNDGVGERRGARTPPGGSGLVGLRERLAPVGGRIDAATADGTFTLTARVPLTAPPPVAPPTMAPISPARRTDPSSTPTGSPSLPETR